MNCAANTGKNDFIDTHPFAGVKLEFSSWSLKNLVLFSLKSLVFKDIHGLIKVV